MTRRSPRKPEFREIARLIAKDSIVTGALGRFIEQIVEETHRIATENERARRLECQPSTAENARLREALKPFAEEASTWADTVQDDYRPMQPEPGKTYCHPGSDAKFSIGDLRRARAALEE